MATQKIHLTKQRVEDLLLPSEGRIFYRDAKLTGFGLWVSSEGTKTFQLYRKVGGRPQRTKLGRFPDILPEQARRKAQRLIGLIADGIDPREEMKARTEELTLGKFFTKYLEGYAKPYKRTWQEDEGQFSRHLKRWSRRRLSSITLSDVQSLHTQIGEEKGVYSANRIVTLLHALFNLAGKWGDFTGQNPAAGVKRFEEESRERYLQPEELPRFFSALEELSQDMRDFFLLGLFTGARKGNLLAMRWDQLRLESATWNIPPASSKNKRHIQVPLLPEAVEILERRLDLVGDAEFVFPGPGKTGHLQEPKKAWGKLLKAAGIEGLRIHDLRRTLGSWQAAQGASLPIIGKSLGHTSLGATQIYSRLNIDPVRASMGSAVEAMLEAGGVTEVSQKEPPQANREKFNQDY